MNCFIDKHDAKAKAGCLFILVLLLGSLSANIAFADNDFQADTVTIVQTLDQGYGPRHVTQTMTIEEFVNEWNQGKPLTPADTSRRDQLESIVPTPEPPKFTAPFQNGDQLVFYRSGASGNVRYNRTVTYQYEGDPGGSGSADDPWAIPSNVVTREGCGASCDGDDEEQITQ